MDSTPLSPNDLSLWRDTLAGRSSSPPAADREQQIEALKIRIISAAWPRMFELLESLAPELLITGSARAAVALELTDAAHPTLTLARLDSGTGPAGRKGEGDG